ncbi:MAG: DUF106 domain-containing protein [Thermoplasmata archaeon]|nr:DUF106 domain-containing protein [Thermoplasmata archaeon]
MAQEKNPQQQPMGSSSMLLMLMSLLLILFLFNSPLGTAIAVATDKTLGPIIGFNRQYPLLTMFFTILLTVGISTTIRHYFADWIAMARSQKIMSEYNRMRTEAMKKNNTAMLKKLEGMQGEIMKIQNEQMSQTMKSSMIPMFLVIIFIKWLWSFMDTLPYPVITMPWTAEWDMLRYAMEGVCCFGGRGLPYWLGFYTLLSLPVSQALMRGLKYIEFERIIRERGLKGET